MSLNLAFSLQDLAYISAALVQCSVVAYVRRPQWKAICMAVPIPFTMASLALGLPLGASHVCGLPLFLGYIHAVRLLYARTRLPIVPCIALSALGYAVAAAALARVIPSTAAAFWLSATGAGVVSFALFLALPHRPEPSHRTPLPLWTKLPVMAAVVVTIVILKRFLGGFMASFPLVSVIGAYEARHSLRAMCRQSSVFVTSFAPALMVVRLLQGEVGLGPAFVVGWAVLVCILVPFSWIVWRRAGKGAPLRRGE